MGLAEIRALKEAASKKVRTRSINLKSEKRKEEDKKLVKVKAEVLKEHPICQFAGCAKKSVDVHHMEGTIGKNYLDKKKMKALCRAHHIFCELNPRVAKKMKMSNSRLTKNL